MVKSSNNPPNDPPQSSDPPGVALSGAPVSSVALSEADLARVAALLREAARTERMLPWVGVRNRFVSWPEFVRDHWDLHGYAATSAPVLRPTAAQMRRLAEVDGWMAWLGGVSPLTARVVWLRSCGLSYRKLGQRAGCSKDKAREEYLVGLYLLADMVRRKNL